VLETGLIVVPARGGSKRLPGKNLRRLGDKTLLEWTAHWVDQSSLGLPVLLTTDDAAIAAEGRRLGWNVPFERPADLAKDDTTTVSTVLHALDWQKSHHGADPDFIVLLQVTSPLRGSACLQQGVSLLKSTPDADAVVGVTRLAHGLRAIYQKADHGFLGPISNVKSHGVQDAFVPNGAFYAIRTEILRTEETFFPKRTVPLVMTDDCSVDIDTPYDWRVAEALLCSAEEGYYD
jgi:CMP-N-acetylneuraminic acid synthetase|tara:strand:- start:187489 stop:188190 length:702 start_codon:yes stop_codon:yes gene_type:complete